MDRLAAAILIAIAALVMTGGMHGTARAGEAALRLPVETVQELVSPAPAVSGPRSARVLSLLIALEALRSAPGALDRSKV